MTLGAKCNRHAFSTLDEFEAKRSREVGGGDQGGEIPGRRIKRQRDVGAEWIRTSYKSMLVQLGEHELWGGEGSSPSYVPGRIAVDEMELLRKSRAEDDEPRQAAYIP